jgi:hypothetical protein
VTTETIGRRWFDHLLSAQKIDHDRAEAAVRGAFAAAGSAEPTKFLWCQSPLEAAWAFLVLVGKTESYNHAVIQRLERRTKDKAKEDQARASVALHFGIDEAEVEGFFGQPFYNSSGSNIFAAGLREQGTAAWLARAEAGDDFLAPHQGGPFRALHDLEESLHFEGERRMQVSLYRQALANADNKDIALLASRSAEHRLYGSLAAISIAMDEALAEMGRLEPTPLQRSLWGAYAACGLWWPCEEGVIFAERPVTSELASDGPRMRWSDGLILGGEPSAAIESAPSRSTHAIVARAVMFRDVLPANHADRIAFLRRQAPSLPLFERYLAGDHEAVWKDLVALGYEAQSGREAADALAVAYETMERVAHNVRTIAERLQAINYEFVFLGSRSSWLSQAKALPHRPYNPPTPDVSKTIATIEMAIEGPLPLSLRAFFEVVGEVNLNGQHPSLAPVDGDIAPDPLMVCSADEALAMLESDDRGEDDILLIEFAPDALHKANVSGGDPYSIAVPDAAADALIEGMQQSLHFVEYLRIAILRWGGFPGWADAEETPVELDALRLNLTPF